MFPPKRNIFPRYDYTLIKFVANIEKIPKTAMLTDIFCCFRDWGVIFYSCYDVFSFLFRKPNGISTIAHPNMSILTYT